MPLKEQIDSSLSLVPEEAISNEYNPGTVDTAAIVC